MRLIFAGTPDVALPSLEMLCASKHEVLAVVTRPDAPAGRGRKLTPSPVARRAEELGLEVLKPTHPRETDFLDRLRALAPELCPVVAYGALLPQSALEIPVHGWLNLHFSVLPRWRGAAPVQRAIMAGDRKIGTSCFRIVRELDAGEIYLMDSQPMPEATAGEVLAKLAHSGAAQLLAAVNLVAAGLKPSPQASEGITLAPKVTPDEARLDWGRPAASLRNHVLGCSPEPGAWCEFEGSRFKVFRAALAPTQGLMPGELAVSKQQVFVGTGEGTLELLEVQASGKRRMGAIDWARAGAAGKLLT